VFHQSVFICVNLWQKLFASLKFGGLGLYLGVLRAGYAFLPLNTAYQASEIEYFIGNAEPAVVVCAPKSLAWIQPIADAAKVARVYTLDDAGNGTLTDAVAMQSDRHEIAQCGADDLAAILYTSGTTGRSKGAMLSHNNLLSNALTLKDYWGWSANDVLIHALPIFHVHGLFVASHCALLSGAKMIWFSKFDPTAVIKRMPEATVFMGVPTLYVRLLANAEPARLTADVSKNMRLFVAGSAPLLIETFNEFRERTGHTILERYGMSETCMLTSNPYDAKHGERRGGTVGFPLPQVQVRVSDDKGGQCPSAKSVASKSKARTCSAAIGACPKRTKKNLPSTVGSRPATWAGLMSAAT
jgi:malonyl-CoA/methylmalonyl-CoA synthetase